MARSCGCSTVYCQPFFSAWALASSSVAKRSWTCCMVSREAVQPISGSTSLAVGSLSSTHRWVLATPDCMAVLAGLKMRTFIGLHSLSGGVVGAAGFEPTTFCAQGRRATRLRYAPPQTLADAGVFTSARRASKAQIPGARVGHVRPDARRRPARPCALHQRAGRTAAALLPRAADRL